GGDAVAQLSGIHAVGGGEHHLVDVFAVGVEIHPRVHGEQDAQPARDVAVELVYAGDGDVGPVRAGDHGDGVADADVAAFGGGVVDRDLIGAPRRVAFGERGGGADGLGVV